MLAVLDSWQGWQSIALIGALGLAAVLAVAYQRRQMRRLTTALDNMSQGLCVFDGAERLRFRNQHYVDMYGLSPDIVKPGCTFREILQYRAAHGTFKGNVDDFRAHILAEMGQGKTLRTLFDFGDGRNIAVISQPMADGGWIATHPTSPSSAGSRRSTTRWRRSKAAAPRSRRRSPHFADAWRRS